MKLIYKMIQTPTGVVLAGALLGLCLSSYPIIFFGKSYVSPGYGTQLLYDQLPFVPGYSSTDREDLPADYGAMPWQNLPYSRVQHEAVFKHGEFPLWNRYNSAGLPLFGQGQSQFLDPLHWIAVAGEGNGWAWDLKFLLSKLIFLTGIGACVFLMTGNRVVTVAVTASAAFIGFFYFRFNHPSYFILTYAPWVLFFYRQLVQSLEFSHRRLQVAWRWLPVSGIFFASIFLLFSGTPKESAILFSALHFSGFIGVVAASRKSRELVCNLGLLISLWIAIALASAPHWLIFVDTLSKVSTSSDASLCNSYSFLGDFRILIDTLFFGSKNIPWGEPNTNTFIFFGVVLAVLSSPHLIRKNGFLMTVLPIVGLLLFSFGIVPDSVCQRIPFIRKIHHVNSTFLTATIPFLILLSAIGYNWVFVENRAINRRFRLTFIILAIGASLFVLLSMQNPNSIMVMNPGNLLALLSIGGVTVLLLLTFWVRSLTRGFSYAVATIAVVLFGLAHAYHGLHIKSGWEELDDLLINPTPRADFLKPSPAIDSLGYLMPTESFGTFYYKDESADICSVAASSLEFEGYVDKYADLLAAYNANSAGKTKSAWGEWHYCNYGRNEGRTYSGQVEKAVIEAILDRAAKADGVGSEIQKNKGILSEKISSSPNTLIMQRHAANFLQRVGAKRWLDDPVRVIGEGSAPMSGFYSYLKLESLNGPDALMNKTYIEFLDFMGWQLNPQQSWLRTMGTEDFQKFEPLLDVLNVGYFLTQKGNPNNWTLESDLTDFRRSLAGNNPISLQKVTDGKIDRVGCHFGTKGLASDGKPDNVFLLDLNFPTITTESPAVIHSIRLVRTDPDRGKGITGRYDTGGNNLVLGVSKRGKSELLNQENGRIQIPTMQSKLRLWIYFCADGQDFFSSDYRAAIHFQWKNKLPLIVDQDMKVWERKHPWPRAFFVDEIAQYNDVALLAEYIRQADGLPLAAIETPHVVRPASDRRVVYAHDYKLTANTTSFTVDAPGPGIVVLTEVNMPGDVHVKIDGNPGEVLLVNHTFRAVKIHKPGAYRISFYYRPRLWRISLLLSFVGLIILIGGLVVKLRQPNHTTHSFS